MTTQAQELVEALATIKELTGRLEVVCGKADSINAISMEREIVTLRSKVSKGDDEIAKLKQHIQSNSVMRSELREKAEEACLWETRANELRRDMVRMLASRKTHWGMS